LPPSRGTDSGRGDDAVGRQMSPRIHLALGFAEEPVGLWRILASAPSGPALARSFPADHKVFLSGGMQSAAQMVRHVFAFLGKIDPVFEEEYTAERKEFQSELGFDFEADFLSNLVDSWAVGFADPCLDAVVWAFRIRDVSLLSAHLDASRAAFVLEETRRSYRGVTISLANRKAGPFVYSIVEDTLLVSQSEKELRRAVDATLDGTGLSTAEGFQRAFRSLTPRVAKHGFLNIGTILEAAIEEEGVGDAPEEILDWVRALRAAAFAVTYADRTIFLEAATANDKPVELVDLLAMIVVPSVQRARYLSQRAVSMSNIKGLVTACLVYAADHNKQWPATWADLVDSGIPGDDEAAWRLLASPYQQSSKSRVPFYLYRQPHVVTAERPAETVVISEPAVQDGGCMVGFMDGHVEWVTSPRAERFLDAMREGRKR